MWSGCECVLITCGTVMPWRWLVPTNVSGVYDGSMRTPWPVLRVAEEVSEVAIAAGANLFEDELHSGLLMG